MAVTTKNIAEDLTAINKNIGTENIITEPENNTVVDDSNKPYYDATKTNKEAYSPNKEGYTNTGSGVEAALGADGKPLTYSWETKAQQLAEKTYQQKVTEEKQNLLTNRQQIEQNAQQYQAQSDMQKYSDRQVADKMGWTGGQILDQARQQEYLKESTQAQLYGAMELQREGLKNGLAAARFAYEANMIQYANEYYAQEQQNSLNEAQITGTYFSAEVKDMLGQLKLAETKLEKDATDERAQTVKENILKWFEVNQISQAGVKTLEAWNAEQSLALQWSEDLWKKYQAALEANGETLAEDRDAFMLLDDNGNPVYDGASIKTGNWNTMSGEQIVDYLTQDKDTEGNYINSYRTQQLYSYLDKQIAGDVTTDFTNWVNKNYGTKDEQGNVTVDGNYLNLFGEYLAKSDIISSFINNKFKNLEADKAKIIKDKLNGYTINIKLPDGTTGTYQIGISTELNAQGTFEGKNVKDTEEPKVNSTGENFILKKDYKDTEKNVMLNTMFSESNTSYKELAGLIDTLISENPDEWNKSIPARQDFYRTTGLWKIVKAVEAFSDADSNDEKRKAIGAMMKEITTKIGDKNVELMRQIAEEFNSLDERKKSGLTQETYDNYKKCAKFIEKLDYLESAYDYYDRNDNKPFTWTYVKNSWENTAHDWSNMEDFGDFFGAMGSTMNSIGTSIVSGVTGFFSGLFWRWWQDDEDEAYE